MMRPAAFPIRLSRTLATSAACLFFSALAPFGTSALSATNVGEGNNTQTIHIAVFSNPDDLDPQLINNVQLAAVFFALFEGLAVYDPATCEPRPGVAGRWEVSPDNLAWTFHLRDDARWSNGDPVTAHDFVFSYRRLLAPRFASTFASQFYCLKNARAYNTGKITDPALIGVRAEDDRTLVLSLEHPVPHLPAMLCHNAWLPVHRATIEKFSTGAGGNSDIARRGTGWTRPGNLVGNGPFTLAEWRPGQYLRVVKNPRYWDRDAVRLNAAVFHIVENENTEERMFRAGQLHITATLPFSKIETYARAPGGARVAVPMFCTYLYHFNTTRPPFDDPRVRRALAMSIDRARLVKHITRGGQTPAAHLCPPNVPGYEPAAGIPHDPAAARALLAGAGYPGGKNFPKTELTFFTSEVQRVLAEAVQQMWRRELGIEVTLRNQEPKVFYTALLGHDYQIAGAGSSGDYLDPGSFLDEYASDSTNNVTGWKSTAYDRLVEAARRATNIARRYEQYQRCEHILADECPVAPVYFYMTNYLRHPGVKGWRDNPLNMRLLKGVWLE